MAQDPWEEAAKAYKPQPGGAAQPSATQKPGEDWRVWQQTGGDTEAPQTTLQKIGSGALDLAKGVGEGALSTISSGDEWARTHLPAFMTNSNFGFGPPADLEHVKQLATPANTTQSVGKGIEQIGEFLIPGAGEEKLAATGTNLLSRVPRIGRAAPVLAKMGASAVGAGLVNKAQGGSFTSGAEMGAAGAGVGQAVKRIAPILAETALKVRGADRAFKATPGRAILDHTSGFAPSKVVDSARQALSDTQAEQGHLLANVGDTGARVDLFPARKLLSDAVDRAELENHPGTIKDLEKLAKQLDEYHASEAAIPPMVHPLDASALNRGISNAITSWNPATANDTMSAAGKMAHHSLGESIAQVAPDITPLNQRIASLHPVIQRGNAADLNAGLLQRIVGRFGTPTGALVGGAAGYQFAGIPGALGGLVVPEVLSNPTTLMMGARAANSPVLRKFVIPAAQGGLLQMGRKSPFSE